MYHKELEILNKKNRFRKREIFDNLIDFASNDYLGLAQNPEIMKKSCKFIDSHGAKASMLVNGYNRYHQLLEEYLCEINDYEAGIVVGSGFLANMSVFEALARKGDLIVLDEEYHASGRVGVRLSNATVRFFKHNNLEDLIYTLKDSVYFNRVLVGIEGIYSMSGDIVKKEIVEYLSVKNVITVIDEAHSVGVVGDKLMGVVDLYKIPTINTIKIGTLGKALGSYGAYILSNKEIISFLENRAKGIIYTTALSNFDTIYAYFALKHIENNLEFFKEEIYKRKQLINRDSLIYIQEVDTISQEDLIKKGFLVGYIRPPTTPKEIFRVVARVSEDISKLKEVIGILE
jgi:8-amino-7-oxononanoate synthase